MDEENILLSAALEYAKKGWYVFPCREVDSEPFIDKKTGKERIMRAKSPYVKEGFHSASIIPEQVREWWRLYPNAAIGVACGLSKIVVVDIDVKDGRNGFENFMRLNISDVGTLHALTPSGGTHIIYSGEVESSSNALSGIDIRSTGGYILAPPSTIFVGGKLLKYIKLDNWNKIPAPVPDDLVEKLSVYKEKLLPPKKKRTQGSYIDTDSYEEKIKKIKVALDKLPMIYCDEYSYWVNVGLSLKSLGEDGFALWDNWSQKSSKYDADVCRIKWESFSPKAITIASLFFWASQEK